MSNNTNHAKVLPSSHRAPLSVVIITLNAASQLEPTLQSSQFADEILVLDSGSQDDTVSLAQRYHARVLHQDWLGFGPQKNFAVNQAKNDWVLCLDADERLSPELSTAIQSFLLNPATNAARFARCNRFLGRYLRHGEGYPDWSLRLFNRHHAHWSDDPVHEKVILTGNEQCTTLPGDLLHDSAETLENYINKQNRYTSLAADVLWLKQQGQGIKTPGAARLLLSPLLRFIKFYFFRQGFRDGLPGLIHILIGCLHSFLKYAKLTEKNLAAINKNGDRS